MKIGDTVNIKSTKKKKFPFISERFEDNMFVEVTDKSGLWKGFVTTINSNGTITIKIEELISPNS